MCLAQGPQRSDAGKARTRGPSVSSRALYYWWATALSNLSACNQVFYLHYAVFCFANVNINNLPAYFYGIWKVSFSKESMFRCLLVYLIPYIYQRSAPDGSKWRLSLIHYHCVSCQSSSVFWRDFCLHYEYDWKSVSFALQITKHVKRRGFLIFILTLTSYFKFS